MILAEETLLIKLKTLEICTMAVNNFIWVLGVDIVNILLLKTIVLALNSDYEMIVMVLDADW